MIIRLLFITLFSAFIVASTAAQAAQTVYAATHLHLRAGPHPDLPVVVTLQPGEAVELLSCVEGYQWCEVRTDYDEYGWVSSRYLRDRRGTDTYRIITSGGYGGTTAIVIYRPRDYWDRHYRTKTFYRDRDRWFRDRDNGGYVRPRPGHGHDGPRPPRPAPAPRPEPVQKKQPIPGTTYNPLCRMGQSTC